MREKFHERLRRLRSKKGMSMRQMAEKIQVPETTYREWEYGRAIRGEPYLEMAEALNISVYELLAGSAKDIGRLNSAVREIEVALEKIKFEVNSFI